MVSALVVAGLALAGCGVPTDRVPQSLSQRDVPFNLLASDVVTTSTTFSSSPTALATIYLVAADPKAGGQDRLQPVDRLVPTPPTVEKVVRRLLSGPSDAEARRGLRTAVPAGTTILAAPVASGIATIDLSGAFARGTGTEQIIALAQIVFTATSLPGVVGVRFTLEGRPTDVPAGDGSQTRAPLGRANFASYGPA
jgi:spore germination protein GerM